MPNWYQHIDRIGVEIEGAWHPHDSNMSTRIYGDGSVCGIRCGYEETDNGDYFCQEGEIATAPLKSWGALKQFCIDNNPEHVNDSCGTHLHISTKTIGEYNTVLSLAFYEQMIEMLTDYGAHHSVPPEWDKRLLGGNQYCRNKYAPEAQLVEHKPEERYSFLNYCFATHGTFEIRVLPAFEDSMDLLHAVKHIVAWVNGYIGTNIDKPESIIEYPVSMNSLEMPTNLKHKSNMMETAYATLRHNEHAARYMEFHGRGDY